MSIIEKLEENLKYLDFTQYEAKTLITLIIYNNLEAKELAIYSNVPQPKIYETMAKLQSKGFVEIISQGKKKYYKIRSKYIITQILEDNFLDLEKSYKEVKNEINLIYSSKKTSDIPFIGIAGIDKLEEYLVELFEEAEDQINCFLADKYYSTSLISTINKASNNININLIFKEKTSLTRMQSKLTKSNLYYIEAKVFSKIQDFFEKIPQFVPELSDNYGFSIIKNLVLTLDQKFGLVLADHKKSIFIVPFPFKIPITLISTLPELIEFHSKGINEILKSSTKI